MYRLYVCVGGGRGGRGRGWFGTNWISPRGNHAAALHFADEKRRGNERGKDQEVEDGGVNTREKGIIAVNRDE